MSPREFLRRYLEPADRLGEVLFGLIMALGFTGAVRLGQDEADNQALLIGIAGCNIAWAIVDGVMYVLGALFERGRTARVIRDVRRAPDEATALQRVEAEFAGPLLALSTAEERQQLVRAALMLARRTPLERPRLQRDDLLGGVAVALIIILATLPLLIPFIVVADPNVAVRLSNTIALSELFLAGAWWGREVGASPLRIATGLTLVGVVLVLITIALGG